MSTRFKLDAVGVKLSLRTWNRLAEEERLVLCHLSVRSQGERECYRRYLEFLLGRLGDPLEEVDAKRLRAERADWENLTAVPLEVARRAAALGSPLTEEEWIQMDDLERYALVKLAGGKHDHANFQPALEEFRDRHGMELRRSGQESRTGI